MSLIAPLLQRDTSSEPAKRLAARAIPLAEADLDDAASLARAARGAAGLFSVQLAPRLEDLDSEARTGRSLIKAARTAGVRQIVHTSVARAGDHARFEGWPRGAGGRITG